MNAFSYTEKQRFTQNEIVYVPIGFFAILFFAVAASKNLALALAIPASLFFFARLIARSIKMDLTMSEEGIHIKVSAVLKETVLIPWSDLTDYSFSGLKALSFGGYGIRYAMGGKGYIVDGRHLLKVVYRGKTLFLSIKNRTAVENALQHFHPQPTISNQALSQN